MRGSVYAPGPYAARFAPARTGGGQPALMGDLNITPLIDVMLVLLVMLILLLPIATHEVPMDLPQPGRDPALPLDTHRLVLMRNGALTLDGTPVTDAALPARLAGLVRDPQAVLTLRTDPEACYERFNRTLAVVKRAGVTRLGFEGNERLVE